MLIYGDGDKKRTRARSAASASYSDASPPPSAIFFKKTSPRGHANGADPEVPLLLLRLLLPPLLLRLLPWIRRQLPSAIAGRHAPRERNEPRR